MTKDTAPKIWLCLALAWPVLCVVFAVLILCDTGRTAEQRLADSMFTLLPLTFFAIGMKIRRRLLAERRTAVVFTTAEVISDGRRTRSGHVSFFPQFRFFANGLSHDVTARSGSGIRRVREGERVELYYAPENPRVFYVQELQKHDMRVSSLLCALGFVFPLLGLFAPLLRSVIPIA